MSKRRKICFLSLQARGAFFSHSPGKIGGAEVQVCQLARWLARQGSCEPMVIVEDNGQPEREQVDGVILRKIKQPADKNGLTSRMWRKTVSGVNLWRVIRDERPDVTVQRGEGIETWLAERAAHSVDSSFIFMTSHDPGSHSPWLEGRRPIHWLFRHGMNRADGIICQHAGQAKRLQTQPVKRPVDVLASLYDFSTMETRQGGAVLWLGRCDGIKGPLAFLELARRLPAVPFLMVALPVDREIKLFEQVKAEAGELPNLTLIPGVPRTKTPGIYRRAEVLVNTSLREGMPNVFLEATQYGLALASLNVDPDGMFSEKGLGFCAGGDMERLTAEVEILSQDEDKRQSLARQAQVRMRLIHHIDTVGPQFLAMIDKIMA